MSAEVAGLVRDLVRSRAVGDASGLWETVQELGLHAIGVAEERGGSGGTWSDLATVVQGLAAHGIDLPLAERAVSLWALQGDTAWASRTGTVAVVEVAELVEGRVSATCQGVRGLQGATVLVLVVPDRVAPLVIDPRGEGCMTTWTQDLSGGSVGLLELDGVVFEELGVDTDVVLSMLALLRAASMVGAAQGAYELTRQHVRTREQFGKPLVALPAVATALASMRVELLQSVTALRAALEEVRDDTLPVRDEELLRILGAALSARVISAGTATRIAGQAHQLHGAIGTTQEYSLHHLTKLLWAGRDVDRPQRWWEQRLGRLATRLGEDIVWDVLTATCSFTSGHSGPEDKEGPR